ncbi:hypothetical protein QFC20_000729 [Naganishia adeliensis]|uniref:Uncharacterized protein n=1 Tax=Naganishia adeliensis TaxID=92952 RepID=A0ACC2WZV0_9TREE|nr:hypothetical protein QFC20_000729 [Naganishia adeliensis]
MSKRPGDQGAAGDPKRAKTGQPGMASQSPAGLDMAAIRAQIAARMAALGKPASSASPVARSPAPSPPIAAPASGASGLTPDRSKPRLGVYLPPSRRRRTQAPTNPYLAAARPSPPVDTPPVKPGLGSVAPHPLLADLTSGSRSGTPTSSGKNRYAPMVPKFTSVKANARFAGAAAAGATADPKAGMGVPRIAPSLNPYTAAGAAAAAATIAKSPSGTASPSTAPATTIPDLPTGLSARRARPTLKFNQKGKYIQRAEEMRHEAKMEALRQRIAENARKAGLDSEFEVLERSVKRQPPPEVEWWDAPLLRDGKYDDLDKGMKQGTIVLDDQNQHVTLFVQHPIPIPAPWEGKTPELRGLMLTKKEQRKMRRQRRAAELQDKRDRQKMGLLPPDPPKIRLQNMMRVLTSAAVSDPTKVEARVRAEAAARQNNHERDNAERKLTDEQRREKLEMKKAKDETKGLVGAAFKIKYLVNGAHRFKIRRNAEQLALNGLLLFHADFAMVYVEGSANAIKKYKRLLLSRIDWTEEARPKPLVGTSGGGEGMDVDPVLIGGGAGDEDDEDNGNANRSSWEPMQAHPETMADNRCELVWEGEVEEKHFRSFRYRNIEADREAREMLGKAREGLWDLAKRWIWEGVD